MHTGIRGIALPFRSALRGRTKIMTTITGRLARAVCLLTVSVLCSCADTPLNTQESMSVEEARKVIMDLAKPPVELVAEYIPSGVLSSCRIFTLEDHYRVYVRRSGIRIIGQKKYDFLYKSLDPQQVGGNVTLIKSSGIFCSGADNPDILFSGLDSASARRLADALSALKHASPQSLDEEDVAFREVVRSYRSMATKPDLSEAARRYKVQAEGAVRDNDLDGAAEYYEKAIDVAPWWPGGHFNRALVLSQTGEFSDAIAEMKRYVELVPDAPDVRDAQDKIYDWERKVN